MKKFKNSKKIFSCKRTGVGDEIFYGSMYRDFEKLDNITIECDPRLLKLFKKDHYKNSNSF